MAGWDDEFGYELIEGETELTFPPSDPNLKRVLQGTVQTARERQAILAAAMPSRFDTPAPSDFAPPEGEAWGGMAEDSTSGRIGRLASDSAAARTGGARNSGTAGHGGSPSDTASSGPRAGQAATSERLGRASSPAATTGSPPPAPGATPGQPQAGNPAGAGSKGDQAGGQGGNRSDATPGAGANGEGGGASLQSMAKSKGANWALPNNTANATGITRPITVHCYPDRLVILPDRRSYRDPKTIAVQGPTHDAMEEFVSAVWTHMEDWGMAVAGGYWKPSLKVTVFPGAETRFWELQALLADSGLDVERR